MENRAPQMLKPGLVGLTILLAIGAAAGQVPAAIPDKKGSDVFKNLKVLNDTPSDQLLPAMQFITSSLGVHCEYCHVEKAFEKDDKKPKETARQMMRMVQELNRNQFQGKQEVTCFTCHRGTPAPLTVPVIAKSPEPLLSKSASGTPQDVPAHASPPEIIARYIKALGGEDAIASLTSIEQKGIFRADSHAFPLELYQANSARSATVIHFPGSNRITAFDGTSGWIALPGRPLRPMTSGEADAARMDSDLHFALNLNTIFHEIKFTGSSKVGTEQAFIVSGQRPGFPPVEMYFGQTSGLLLRMVHYLPSPLGLNPTQVDYSDYRVVAGVRIPFRWTSATPTGSYNVLIETTRANVAIPEKVFSMPAAP